MLTYTTLTGQVLDLSDLTDEQQQFLDRCWQDAQRGDVPWLKFAERVSGPENPVVRDGGGRVTDAVWNHPLFQAVRDLEDRVGLIQGALAEEEGLGDPRSDPFADTWIPASEAAEMKGVALSGLHNAIRHGKVIAHPRLPGGKHIVVSANSLANWRPNRTRQAAGRKRAVIA